MLTKISQALCSYCPCFQEETPQNKPLLETELKHMPRLKATKAQSQPQQSRKEHTALKIQKAESMMLRSKKSERPHRQPESPQIRSSLNSEESFRTVKSTSSKPLSRRSFRILKSFHNDSKSPLFKNITLQIESHISPDSENSNLKNYIAPITQWLQSEYEKVPESSSLKIQASNLLKIENHTFFTSMVHKLQDFYTFYEQSQAIATFSKDKNCFRCSCYRVGQNNTTSFESAVPKYLSLCTFMGNTLQADRVINWLFSLESQAKLSNLYQLKLIWPHKYLQVIAQQFSQKLHKMQKYHFVKQFEMVRFQNEEGNTILSIDINLNEGRVFDRLIRLQIGQKALVEIYTQSSETIVGDQSQYFLERWQEFYSHLISAKVLEQ